MFLLLLLPQVINYSYVYIQDRQLIRKEDEDNNNQVGEKNKRIVVGPWGGNGGSDWDDGSYNGIREITIVHARCIDSIKVVYDKNGRPFMGEKHGGVGGSRTSEVKAHPQKIKILFGKKI